MDKLNFVALDLETATSDRSSICELGIAIVRDGVITQTKSWLIKPEGNIFDYFNIDIHGITPKMTESSPSFADVWKEVEPYLLNQVVVAHNTSFDMYALKDAFEINKIDYPSFTYYCSYRITKYVIPALYSYSLDSLSLLLNIPHKTRHRAGEDAELCAKVFIHDVNLSGVETLDQLEDTFGFCCGMFEKAYHRPQRSTKSHHRERDRKFEYIGDPSKFDENNYFYGKRICFTGKCMYGTRDDMCQKVADIGGIPVKGVTKETEILVVGQQDYRRVGEDGLSTKQEKAIKLIDSGCDIEIFSEAEFLQMF